MTSRHTPDDRRRRRHRRHAAVRRRLLHPDAGSPHDAVERLFARILQDTRHRDGILALHEPTRGRAFDGWSMGFEHLDASDSTSIPGFTTLLEAPPDEQREAVRHGRAGVFHRVFRNRMR